MGASCVREGPLCCDGGAGAVKDFPPYYCGVFLSVDLDKQEGERGISAYFGPGGTVLLLRVLSFSKIRRSIYSSGRWLSGFFLCHRGTGIPGTSFALPLLVILQNKARLGRGRGLGGGAQPFRSAARKGVRVVLFARAKGVPPPPKTTSIYPRLANSLLRDFFSSGRNPPAGFSRRGARLA